MRHLEPTPVKHNEVFDIGRVLEDVGHHPGLEARHVNVGLVELGVGEVKGWLHTLVQLDAAV